MKTIISGKNYKISETLKQYSNKKIDKLYNFSDKITQINLIFSINNLDHIAEANLFIPGETINAKASSDNMNAAVDALVEKLSKQIKKYKNKRSKQT
jgi:putative sigma-54 modulation protein